MSFRPFGFSPPSVNALQDEMRNLIERVWHTGLATGPFDGQAWAPLVDLYEHGHCYKLYADVPGVPADKVELTVMGTTLTIRGQKNAVSGVDGETGEVLRNERRLGAFSRSVELPPGIDPDGVSASARDGVLEITIPKLESVRARAVRVDSASS